MRQDHIRCTAVGTTIVKVTECGLPLELSQTTHQARKSGAPSTSGTPPFSTPVLCLSIFGGASGYLSLVIPPILLLVSPHSIGMRLAIFMLSFPIFLWMFLAPLSQIASLICQALFVLSTPILTVVLSALFSASTSPSLYTGLAPTSQPCQRITSPREGRDGQNLLAMSTFLQARTQQCISGCPCPVSQIHVLAPSLRNWPPPVSVAAPPLCSFSQHRPLVPGPWTC